MSVEKLWKLKELRSAWQISDSTIRRDIHDGALQAVRVGKRGLRVPDSEVRRYLEAAKRLMDAAGIGSTVDTTR